MPAEPKIKALTNGEDAKAVATLAEAKDGLQKFVDSMHQKAAALTSWIAAMEPPSNPKPSERQVKSLVSRF